MQILNLRIFKCFLIFLITIFLYTCNQKEAGKPPVVIKPVITSDWWRICEMPDLNELNGPDLSRQHVVDHGFIQSKEGKWQLWACIRGTAVGRILYGWEGDDLESGPWKPVGITARADSSFGEKTSPEESIQAPFFLKAQDHYYCFYNSNGARIMRSDDGVNYSRYFIHPENNLLYKESGRDVMVMKEGDRYFSYSTVSTVARDGWKYGFVILRTSEDLKKWSDYTIVSSGGIAGNGPISAESPFVIKIRGYYFLFRASSVTGKTYVYQSESPYHFGINEDSKLVTVLDIKAPEIILNEGQYFISDLADFQGIKLARIQWVIENAP
jgi:hypothetical protein